MTPIAVCQTLADAADTVGRPLEMHPTTRVRSEDAVGGGLAVESTAPPVSHTATADVMGDLVGALADLVRAVPVGAVDPGWEEAASVVLGRLEAMEARR